MLYKPELEVFRDFVDFGPSSPCIWVVYPPGAVGDLLASLINFHFVETGARFRGINEKGQVIFRPSDQKITNSFYIKKNNIEFNDQFFFDIADKLSNIHTNYSKLDQFVFSNHAYHANQISSIIDTFVNSRIVRIMPMDDNENRVSQWMAYFKNLNIALDINKFEFSTRYHDEVKHEKLLTIGLCEFLDPLRFQGTYNKILKHLGLEYQLINYDFIQYWLQRQDPVAREFISNLFA